MGLSETPDLQTLTTGLSAVLAGDRLAEDKVVVLARERIGYGTFPKEIVTCLTSGGSELRLFCKYGAGLDHRCHGHRGGLAYEAAVYRHVLKPYRASTAKFYGLYTAEINGEPWLILEYLTGSMFVTKGPEPAAMNRAAAWIGRFHASQETRLASLAVPLLRYDAGYFLNWVRQTGRIADSSHQGFPWLASLCKRSGEFLARLLAPPSTVIHGEYYPKNVLYRRGSIYPVDWESAAIAAGEIDLAALTEGWEAESVRECCRAYQRARWPAGTPADFEQRLATARLYLHFRWLGEQPDQAWEEDERWRFEELRSAGQRLGLI
jgi:aminoglycoside phosphotransferase (APT) family kinase protein